MDGHFGNACGELVWNHQCLLRDKEARPGATQRVSLLSAYMLSQLADFVIAWFGASL
jgi:hypothetical protein